MRLLTWLRRFFPDDPSRLSAYGDLVEEYEARTRMGGRAGLRFWWRALRLTVGYGIWARLRRGRLRRSFAAGRWRGGGSTWRSWAYNGNLVDGMIQDIKYAIRALLRSPGYTTIVVVILALGIGANSALFSVVNALLLKPPTHVENPDELVTIWTSARRGPRYASSSYLDFVDFRAQTSALAGLAAFDPLQVNLAGPDGVSRILLAESVSGNYFELLGVRPTLGRTFSSEEGSYQSGLAVAVVSHAFWQREFGGDPDIIGQTLRLSGNVTTIIGVAPDGFGGSFPVVTPDFWLPESTVALISGDSDFTGRGNRGLFLRGRLAPGATLEQAQAQLDVLAIQLQEEHQRVWTDINGESRKITIRADTRLPPQSQGAAMGVAALLMGVVGTVLLIACANVANLTLARATKRRQEVAIRLALGSGRGRLIRQFLSEGAIVGLLGGSGGLAIALLVVRFAEDFRPTTAIQLALDVSLDASVLMFVAAVTILTVLIVQLIPALRFSRPDLVPALKQGGESAPGRNRWYELRNLLVVSQVSASLVLLVGAGLFMRSLQATTNVDPGFNPAGVATATMELGPEGYTAQEATEFYQAVTERMAGLPGVVSVSMADRTFLDNSVSRTFVSIPGYTPEEGEDMGFQYFRVGAGFVSTLEMRLVGGREFTPSDAADAPPVVMVNESFAQRFWPGQNALGQLVTVAGRSGDAQVVGVLANTKYNALTEDTRPVFFQPTSQNQGTGRVLLVKTTGNPEDLLSTLRAEIAAVDPAVPLSISTYEAAVAFSTVSERITVWVLSIAGSLGLLLTVVGLYGVMSYLVSQRTREVGVRMALGAQASDVIRMILGRGLLLAMLGALIGMALSAGASLLLSSFLFGVSPLDPMVFVMMPVGVGLVAALASYVPARKAARVQPAVTLRAE